MTISASSDTLYFKQQRFDDLTQQIMEAEAGKKMHGGSEELLLKTLLQAMMRRSICPADAKERKRSVRAFVKRTGK